MKPDDPLLKILACPLDKGPLSLLAPEDVLYNPRLRRRYPILDGIPQLLPSSGEQVTEAEHQAIQRRLAQEQGAQATEEPAGQAAEEPAAHATKKRAATAPEEEAGHRSADLAADGSEAVHHTEGSRIADESARPAAQEPRP